MPNQYINKVVYGGSPLIDLTSDTAVASDVAVGKYFHLATGERVEGTASGGGGSGGNVWQDAQGYVHLDDEGGGSSVDVEPLSVTQNGTYTAPAGTAYSPVTVNVSGGGGNDFVVTLGYDGTIDFAPDCTYAELESAYQDGKNIVFSASGAACSWDYTPAGFEYSVYIMTNDGTHDSVICVNHLFTSNGVTVLGYTEYPDTSIADAVAADVAQGKTFFSANGYETGTASGGMPSGFAVGTLTVASDVATTSSVKITDTTELGFTPTKFYFFATSNPESAGAIYTAVYEGFASYNVRMRAYFSNNALSASAGATSWTSSTSGHLYFSSNTVYINASSTYVLKAGTYGWVAIQ